MPDFSVITPSKLHDVFSMKSIFVLIFLFFWQVLIRIIKNFVGDIFSLLFELPFALIVLFLNHWPRFSLDLPWYVCIAYFILAFRVFIGLFRTVIDLPGYFLAFVHLLVYGIDELDA